MAAGELGALVAEPDSSLAYQGAPFHEVGAFLLARDASGALGDLDALFPRPVNEGKVTRAHGAVDAAGSDEPAAHRYLHGWGIGGGCFQYFEGAVRGWHDLVIAALTQTCKFRLAYAP